MKVVWATVPDSTILIMNIFIHSFILYSLLCDILFDFTRHNTILSGINLLEYTGICEAFSFVTHVYM